MIRMDVGMLAIFLILCFKLQQIVCLECYNCNAVNGTASCKNTTQCLVDQVCYVEHRTMDKTQTFTLGCLNLKHCGAQVGGSTVLVGRDTHAGPTQYCRECCSTTLCNKNLCGHPKPSACIDDEKADCPWLNSVFNICNDILHAKTECPKFCGLCTIVDGNWAQWSKWSHCDVTCENGTQVRKRTCTNPAPVDGGLDCVGNGIESKTCERQLCPVHGGWSTWANWEPCSVTCDIGIQRRHRNCSNPYPDRFGDHCFGESMDVQICTPIPCANGGWSKWTAWGLCSNVGLKSRYRTCTNPYPSILGQSCVGSNVDKQPCNTNSCDACYIPPEN